MLVSMAVTVPMQLCLWMQFIWKTVQLENLGAVKANKRSFLANNVPDEVVRLLITSCFNIWNK